MTHPSRDLLRVVPGSSVSPPALTTISSRIHAILTARYTQLSAFALLLIIVFHAPLTALSKLIVQDESYNYIALVPVISIGSLFMERRRIFTGARHRPAIGLPLMLLGVVAYFTSELWRMRPVSLSLAILALLMLCYGAFVLCYGAGTFRRAVFPLLFLLWMVPAPAFILNKAIEILQTGSAGVSYVLFRLTGVPVLKDGFSFFLPGVEVEVARQCSGIRSSASLLIAGLLAGHVFLQSNSRKALLALCIVPVVIFKNAVRIVTISLLGLYVDRGFFTGSLHRQYGGLVFSALAFAILIPVIWLLQKSEHPDQSSPVAAPRNY